MARTQTLRVEIVGDTRDFQKSLARVQGRMGAFGSQAQRLNQMVSRGFMRGAQVGVAGAAGGLVFAVKKASDFEGQLSALGSVAEANGKQMARFRKQALKAGADTKFSALEAAQAQTELAKGGLRVSQIMRGGLKSSLALAAAGEMDLAEAAEATVNAMKLFGLRGKDSMKVADGFATAANRTTADVSDFAMALKMGGSAAKASGLNFIETTAALEALAEIGIKGSDAGTSLKAMLTQLAAPTAKQRELAKKLNVEFFDQHGNMKSLSGISRMLGDRLDGMSKKQQLQTVKTLAGTDGMRAMLALYDAGPKKLRRFQDELGKEGTAADVAKRKQDNLKGSLEQLGGSAETLGIQIGTMMIPWVRKGADEVRAFADDVGKIVRRDDLSIGEKLQKSLEVAKVQVKPWVDKLQAALERAELPRRFGELLSKAAPVLAEAAAKSSVVAAKSFVTAFMAADVWGRLAAGAWLLTRMGGPPAFMRMGTTAGVAMGGGMATGVATSGLKGKLGGLFRSWGPTLGIGLAATVGPEFIKALDEKAAPTVASGLPKTRDAIGRAIEGSLGGIVDSSKGLKDRLRDSLSFFTDPGGPAGSIGKALGLSMNFEDPQRKMRQFGESAEAMFRKFKGAGNIEGMEKLADQARAYAREFPKAAEALNKFAADVEKVSQPARKAREAIQRMATGSANSIGELRNGVRFNTKLIKKHLGEDTAEGKEALSKNFRAAVANIRTSMAHGKITTKEGTAEIERLMVKALQGMGFSKKQAIALRSRGAGSTQTPSAGGELRPNQRGSFIGEGKAFGDSVPSLLERGEYVLNRNAVKKVGRQNLDRINFGQAPRFQQGGIVELLHPDNDPAGHGGSNSHLHVAHKTQQGIIALGKRLQKLGWIVGEHPAFGGVGGMHAPGGFHYTGQAIDVNWPNAGQELAKIRALLPMLGGAGGLGGLTAAKIKRMLVGGPDSPLKSLAQGALDLTRGAAQSLVDGAAGGLEGAEVGVSGDGDVESVFASVARSLSRSKIATKALGMAGYAESGMRDLPGGHSTSEGALQLLASTAAGMGIDPHDEGQVASAFLQRGYYGKGGANALAAKGLPAHLVAQNTQGSAFSDGSNYLAQAGPAAAWMRRFGLQAGGFIGRPGRAKLDPKVRLGNLGKRSLIKSPKLHKQKVSGLVERIRGIGLPGSVQSGLKQFAGDAAIYGEMADRASQLSTEDAEGNTISGVVGGKTQTDWLSQQLEALFKWRNQIVIAEELIRERREHTSKLIEQARERLKKVQANISQAVSRRKRLARELDKARKHPKRNRALIKVRRAQIKGLDQHIQGRSRLRDALKERVLPALTGKRAALNTARGDLLTNLEDVQGVGSPMGFMRTLPATGVLGGQILQVQTNLRDLLAPKPKITDDETLTSDLASQRADLAEERARNDRAALNIMRAQVPVLKDLPRLMGLPSFGGGGVVPGPRGASQIIEAHGREVVLTPEQAAAMGGGGPGSANVRVILEDHRTRVLVDDVEQVVETVNRKIGSQVGLGFHGIRSAPGNVAGY